MWLLPTVIILISLGIDGKSNPKNDKYRRFLPNTIGKVC